MRKTYKGILIVQFDVDQSSFRIAPKKNGEYLILIPA
jgi:hypothetical protein